MEKQKILAVIQADLQLICSVRDGLEASGLANLSIARNSEEAILYLRGVGIYGDRHRHPLPSVVLLDCSNPDGSDLEVLSWMREREEFRGTPVVMLCEERHSDLHVACALDENCLIADRKNMDDLADAVGNLSLTQFISLVGI
jgi:CheY-like chemotaxis protein